jgi:hypothetical protein
MSQEFASSISNFTGSPIGPFFESTVSNSNDLLNKVLYPITDNTPIVLIMKLMLILYGAMIAPQLSSKFSPFISNAYFRVAMLSLVAWVYSKDPVLSILIGTCYYLTVTFLTKNSVGEAIENGELTPEIVSALDENVATIPLPLVAQPQQNSAVNYGLQDLEKEQQEKDVPLITANGEIQEGTPGPDTTMPHGNVPTEVAELAGLEEFQNHNYYDVE